MNPWGNRSFAALGVFWRLINLFGLMIINLDDTYGYGVIGLFFSLVMV